MKINAIPSELFSICKQIVEKHHGKHGLGNLPANIETSGNINTLSLIPEASDVLKANNRYYKIRKWCFLVSIGFVCLSVLIPFWSLPILVLLFIADRTLAYREKKGWTFLSTVLLSLEILANDFSGWGSAYPIEHTEASDVLRDNQGSLKSTWLDYYLPKRATLDPALLKAFEPSMPRK
jgi:hypothetical protein